jgi:hypothetical protein|tara:strand:+ start:178 stop:351 length:174 start_codon:yes stop_codon:yes gene_type:complete
MIKAMVMLAQEFYQSYISKPFLLLGISWVYLTLFVWGLKPDDRGKPVLLSLPETGLK